jgi:hypothetical protein
MDFIHRPKSKILKYKKIKKLKSQRFGSWAKFRNIVILISYFFNILIFYSFGDG